MKFSVFKSCGWRRQLAVLLIFVMVLQLPVAAGAQEKAARLAETINDQANREVSVRFPSERIVCLQHHSLDIITQVGGQKSLVGVVKGWERLLGGYMRDVLPGIEALPTPGDLNDCNVEEIAKLKPDLVIVAVQFDKGKIAQLEKLGIPVLVVALRTWQGEQKEAQSPDFGPKNSLSSADARALLPLPCTGCRRHGADLPHGIPGPSRCRGRKNGHGKAGVLEHRPPL